MEKLDREVDYLVKKKIKSLSFEIKNKLVSCPEVETLADVIEKSIENYSIARKMGKMEEAKLYITHVKQMKFAKEHLLRVMNMDFDKPTKKLKKMAEGANIDLNDPKVIAEFKVIQQ